MVTSLVIPVTVAGDQRFLRGSEFNKSSNNIEWKSIRTVEESALSKDFRPEQGKIQKEKRLEKNDGRMTGFGYVLGANREEGGKVKV